MPNLLKIDCRLGIVRKMASISTSWLAVCLSAVLFSAVNALSLNNRGLLAAGVSAGSQVSQEVLV